MRDTVVASVRAAQYLRMSTEHQSYSLEAQEDFNRGYARDRGFEIVRTYKDAGISGLRLKGRSGLKQLLADVLGGEANYSAVLVYDVSRWGRFQDLDQGAHYEFICREAGVQIIYTAEPFAGDGSLASTILKHLKRAMAAEYSRDLSAKTHRAQRGLLTMGFWQGGPPGYGLRRCAVTMDRAPRLKMEAGEQKALRGQRTILVPGPPHEIETVQRIYRLFAIRGMRVASIAQALNQEGVTGEDGARWTGQRVRQVLTADKYVGDLVGGKCVASLGSRRYRRRSDWVRVPRAVEAIVPRELFDLAQTQMRRPKARGASDQELLAELRQVLADHGRLTNALINVHPQAHCASVYKQRFGTLERAYALVGYTPSARQVAAAENARRHRPDTFRSRPVWIDPVVAFARLEAHFAERGWVSSNTINDDPNLPSADWYRRQFGGMARLYELLNYQPSVRQRTHMGRDSDPPLRTPS